MNSPTSLIKAKAREVGFSNVGVARAEHLNAEGEKLREWLGRRFHGTMDWMASNAEKRTDPVKILPGAKSVVCVAINYYSGARHSGDPRVGKISRYAWGDDYHHIVRKRLELLRSYIHQILPEAATRVYVDTGPVLEKAWAARAGIGWLGKHTNIITKNLGSWVFLGEVIVDAELEYDEPIEDACGTCTACIQACPTGAIVEPYVLDATKCISYLTIEYRGEFDTGASSKFENWVYGCDICQDVCPWNRFQQESQEPAFQPRSGNEAPALEELASISPVDFSGRFRGSAIRRTKHKGLVRNAKAALDRRT